MIALDLEDSWCDCGQPKASHAEACARCTFLDGTGTTALIIGALRGSDGMSLRELCEAVGMNADRRNGQRQMWRWVKPLLEQNRVRRYWRDADAMMVTRDNFGRGARDEFAAVPGSCWVYALDAEAA